MPEIVNFLDIMHSIFYVEKKWLIIRLIKFGSNLPTNVPNTLILSIFSELSIDLAHLLGDLSQIEKLSKRCLDLSSAAKF